MEEGLAWVLPGWNPRGRVLAKGGETTKGWGSRKGLATGGCSGEIEKARRGGAREGRGLCYRGGARGIKETGKGDEPREGGRWDKGGGGPGRCGGGARAEGVRFAGRGCS